MVVESKNGKDSRPKAAYEPDLYTRQEIAEFPWIFRSNNRKTYVLSASKNHLGTYLKGFVESESRRGYYHYVVVLVGKDKDIVEGGFCECESRHFYGKPCKHIASLRNMYIRHSAEIAKLASVQQDIRR